MSSAGGKPDPPRHRKRVGPRTRGRARDRPAITLVVKRTSRDSPKVEAQVRLLAGVLFDDRYPRSVVEARDPAKVEDEVQLLTGILAQRPLMVGMV